MDLPKYTFYYRNLKHGKIIYVRFYDPDTGKRQSGISTGCTNIRDADRWVYDYVQRNPIVKRSILVFSNFTKGWFEWGECKYIALCQRTGHSFSKAHADTMKRNLKNYLIPYFGKMKITHIAVSHIETFLQYLIDEKQLSSSTVNGIYNCLSLILKEAHRTEIIKSNPIEKVIRPKKVTAESGILSLSQLNELFATESVSRLWNSDQLYYLISLIAVTTGMRMGEVLSLTPKNIHDDYIYVSQAWNRTEGISMPKYNSIRNVPLIPRVFEQIQIYLSEHPSIDDTDLIFHGRDSKSAIDHKAVRKAFYRAIERMGIDRVAENITFHSLRHTFASLMSTQMSEMQLQKYVGHKSRRMLTHYASHDNEVTHRSSLNAVQATFNLIDHSETTTLCLG